MARQPKITIKGLNFYYQKKQVIFGLDLSIPAYEILSVFGPANSGITTLLRTLNRLSDLTFGARVEGEILLDGNDIYAPDVSLTELRRKVGIVFDVPAPLPMSIFDNIAYGPRLSGMKSRKAIEECVEQALRRAALWEEAKDRLNKPAMSLSGGQQQRLCIARV